MKKGIVFLIIVLSLIICGCSNRNSTISEKKLHQMIGTYSLDRINEKSDDEQINRIKNNYKIVIGEKYQGILYLNNEPHFITYNEKYIISTDKNNRSERTKYRYTNNKIILYRDNDIYTFKKVLQ